MEGKWKGKERKRKGKGKGKGREREGKGREGKGGKREGEGKGKGRGREREGEGHFVNFCSFGSYRIGFEIPERGDYILSEKIPKQNRNCQCFGLFRFEPKEKKSVSQDTLVQCTDNVSRCRLESDILYITAEFEFV
jgi:hypothetical protein